MACPNCASKNTRVSEPGLINNQIFCLDCETAYESVSPGAKVAVVNAALFVISGGILGSLFGGGGDSSGSGA